MMIDLKQKNNLVIQPWIRQSIELLACSNVDLFDLVYEQSLENPIITLIDEQDETNHSESHPENYGYASYFDEDFIEQIPYHISIYETLTNQIEEFFKEKSDRVIAYSFLDFLNEHGYLGEDIANIAAFNNISISKAEEILKALQSFDPPGIFARNLQESLKIQLKSKGLLSKDFEIILDNLNIILAQKKDALSKVSGVPLSKIDEIIKEIKKLSPYPIVFNDMLNSHTPDLLMFNSREGLSVCINSCTIPRIFIDKVAYKALKTGCSSNTDKEYLSNCLKQANNLTKAIAKREATITKITDFIMSYQKQFFVDNTIKPLKLEDIAEATNLHISTISRAIANKTIQTPKGTFPLNSFLSRGNNDNFSAANIKRRIKEYLENEDQSISDQKIAEKLEQEGIKIARRTVSKYRAQLGCSSSFLRNRI